MNDGESQSMGSFILKVFSLNMFTAFCKSKLRKLLAPWHCKNRNVYFIPFGNINFCRGIFSICTCF